MTLSTETNTEDAFDKEMNRDDCRLAFPNPFQEEKYYPAVVTIQGVTQKFAALRTKQGTTWCYLHQNRGGGLERIARFSISRAHKTKWYSPLVRISDKLKFPALSDMDSLRDEDYEGIKARIQEALKGI